MKTLCFIALFISIGQYLLAGNLKENWIFKTNGRIYSTPAVSLDAVLFGSADSNFYSVDKKTGNLNWSFRTNGGIHSDPAISDSDVLFGSYDGCLYSLDARREWLFCQVGCSGQK